MTRDSISLTVPDISAFARGLKAEMGEGAPGHQSLLNHIARAGGYRNYQHLKAIHSPVHVPEPVDGKSLGRALSWFDDVGRMTNWPTKRKTRVLCLWALWARVPAGQVFAEREISALFDTMTVFRDAAQIRRSLVEDGLLRRNLDGSNYRRVEMAPGETELALIRALSPRLSSEI